MFHCPSLLVRLRRPAAGALMTLVLLVGMLIPPPAHAEPAATPTPPGALPTDPRPSEPAGGGLSDMVDTENLLSVDNLQLYFVIVLLLGLFYLVVIILKRVVPNWLLLTGGGRIGVREIRTLDYRRKLVLIRRDDVEHLLLLGDNGDMIVEAGIRKDRKALGLFGGTTKEPSREPVVAEAEDEANSRHARREARRQQRRAKQRGQPLPPAKDRYPVQVGLESGYEPLAGGITSGYTPPADDPPRAGRGERRPREAAASDPAFASTQPGWPDPDEQTITPVPGWPDPSPGPASRRGPSPLPDPHSGYGTAPGPRARRQDVDG